MRMANLPVCNPASGVGILSSGSDSSSSPDMFTSESSKTDTFESSAIVGTGVTVIEPALESFIPAVGGWRYDDGDVTRPGVAEGICTVGLLLLLPAQPSVSIAAQEINITRITKTFFIRSPLGDHSKFDLKKQG